MPRIYTSTNDPLDFCRTCFPSRKLAQERYADMGDGPDGRGNCFGYNDEHPPYSDTDYTCDSCGRTLTDTHN